ncbi:MAG TPA: AAA family ATPase [Terriglobales bacterium]|nr:AAA family ATPase [Terriglobales bacterium]
MTGMSSRIYEFGPFRLDIRERQLLRGADPIPLRAKVFDTLAVLVQNQGRLLSKDELMQAVWPDAVVEENNLNHNISVLRKALGEKATGQVYVETVPRIGYRFVAEVRPATAAPQTVPSFAPPARPRLQAAPPVFLERDLELRQLHQWLDEALSGSRRVVCIAGDAGLGKTTLVDAFLEQAAEKKSPWIAYGQCLDHHGEGEPYMPVLEALGRLCRGPEAAQVVALLERHAPNWLLQMPWLVGAGEAEALQKRSVGANRERMLRQGVEVLEALAAVRPLVLVFEDLHWADYSSLDLLLRLARRPEPAPLMLIATFRPAEAAAADHPLHAAVEDMKARGFCRTLAPAMLTEAAVAQYLGARLPGSSLPQGLAHLLHQRTEGNPLFVGTLLDFWVAQGAVVESDGGWRLKTSLDELASGVPESLRQLIEQQLAALEPGDREVLAAASVSGMSFSAAAVSAALELPAEVAEARCAALARRGAFLRSAGVEEWQDGTVAAAFTFRHSLYQATLYQRVPAGRRVRLHQLIGERMEAALGSRAHERAAELAEHFTEGRDARRAMHYHQVAAENAFSRSAFREAIAHLQEALAMVRRLPDLPERRRAELEVLAALGPALAFTRGWGDREAESVLRRAHELGMEEDIPGCYPAVFWLAGMFELRGQYRQSQALLEQHVARQPSGERHTPTESHELLACSFYHQGVFEAALEHADHGVSLGDPYSSIPAAISESTTVACHDWAALALWFLGYSDQALQRAEKALLLAADPAFLFSLTHARAQAAHLRQLRREPSLAKEWADAAVSLASEYGFPYPLGLATVVRGWARAMLGSGEEGLAEIHRGMEICRAAGVELDRPYFLGLLAEAAMQAGRFKTAAQALAEGRALAEAARSFFYEAELVRLQGELALASGMPGEPEARFRQALEVARRQGSRALELRAATSLARLLRNSEANASLAEVLGWFKEGFDTPDLRAARELLDERVPAAVSPVRERPTT